MVLLQGKLIDNFSDLYGKHFPAVSFLPVILRKCFMTEKDKQIMVFQPAMDAKNEVSLTNKISKNTQFWLLKLPGALQSF